MDFYVDIDKIGNGSEIIKKGARLLISGTVRKMATDGIMRHNESVCPKIKLYIVLESHGSDSGDSATWGKWMLYREMVWIETDENGRFSFEVNTKRFPVLYKVTSKPDSTNQFFTAREYRIGYSDSPRLEKLHFTNVDFLILEPKVFAKMDLEMRKLFEPLIKLWR